MRLEPRMRGSGEDEGSAGLASPQGCDPPTCGCSFCGCLALHIPLLGLLILHQRWRVCTSPWEAVHHRTAFCSRFPKQSIEGPEAMQQLSLFPGIQNMPQSCCSILRMACTCLGAWLSPQRAELDFLRSHRNYRKTSLEWGLRK